MNKLWEKKLRSYLKAASANVTVSTTALVNLLEGYMPTWPFKWRAP